MQLLAHLKVADYESWRRTFDDDAETRGNAGLTLLQLWRQVDDPNRVWMLYEVSEPAPFIANALLLGGATALCFLSSSLRAGPPDLPGRDETPSPETPPASQPGPEGNR